MCSGVWSRWTNVCCEGHSKVQLIILCISLQILQHFCWIFSKNLELSKVQKFPFIFYSFRSPTHDDLDSSGLPMARGLRPKTKKPTPPPTTTLAPTTTVAPTRAPQQPPPRPNYPPPPPPPGYRQQQGTGAYMPQGYQYPPNYPYYAQSRPQQQQQPPPFFNPFMPYYPGQGGQPMMIPVPVPVPIASMPGLSGIPNLMQPFGGWLDTVWLLKRSCF